MSDTKVCESFTSHPVRKLCRECRKPKEEHPLFEEDAENIKKIIKTFGEFPEMQPNEIYTWIPPSCPDNRVEEYFKKFPENKIPRHKSEGQKNRLKMLTVQIPLSDLSKENCRFIDQESESDFESFISMLKKGILRIGVVKEFVKDMAIQCPKCLLIIESGELVILSTEDGGPSFHPKCFVCFQCGETLADLIHCSDIDGTIFCVRHYSNNYRKRCYTCDELIFSQSYALASENFYHRDHLLCFSCDQVLEGNKGYENAGELFCGICYEGKFCSDCTKCKKRITLQTRHVSFRDDNWHYDCFTCTECDVLLSDNPFEVVDNKFLCPKCYNEKFAPHCAGCNEVFDAHAKVVKYEDKIYHVPCFKCIDCKETIGTGSFVPNKDKVYCKACHLRNFGVRCLRCKYAITDDRGIMYNKQPYHEDCFICCRCSTKISSRPFKTVNESWYCMNCYGEHFCQKCHSCDKPILLGAEEDVLYSYTDYRWHSACFICSACNKSLADTPFMMREKLLVCKGCIQNNEKASKEKIATKEQSDDKPESVSS